MYYVSLPIGSSVYPINAVQSLDLPHTRGEVENNRVLVKQHK